MVLYNLVYFHLVMSIVFILFLKLLSVFLVGTNVGDIAVWEVSCRERLAHRTFKVWDLPACSTVLQVTWQDVEFFYFSWPFLVVTTYLLQAVCTSQGSCHIC